MLETQVDPDFMDNAATLNPFISTMKAVGNDDTRYVSKIVITGYASPEGGRLLNQRLAAERAANMAEYIRSQIELPDSIFSVSSAGIDWVGLDSAVSASDMKWKSRVLDIIRREPDVTYNAHGAIVNTRKKVLMDLDRGRAWNWMMENLYPTLRSSSSVVCYIEKVDAASESEISEAAEIAETSELSELSETTEIAVITIPDEPA